MTDLNTLSNEQLLAIANGGAPPDVGYGPGVRPPDASTGRGVDAWVGSDQMVPDSAPMAPTQEGGFQPPPPPAAPPAATPAPPPAPPQPEQGMAGAVQDRFAAFARGVPILGAVADEGSALANAAMAPAVEPLMKWLDKKGWEVGYDPKMSLAEIPNYGDRYNAALQMQHASDERFDEAHPGQSLALQLGGGVLSGAGAAAVMPRVVAPLTSMMKPGAGIIARTAAAGVEGGAMGAAHGYGMGDGNLDDPSRGRSALVGGAGGLAIGAALPGVMDVVGSGAKALVRPFLGRGRRVPVGAMNSAAETSARNVPRDVSAQAAPLPQTDGDLAQVLAARREIPMPEVKSGAEDDAYAHIARALVRQRQTPQEMGQAVQDLGPLGVIADSGPAMADLTRQAVNRPSGAETIARQSLDARQRGVLTDGEWAAPPSSTRVLNEAQGGLQVPDTKFHQSFDVLNQVQKDAADPLYAQVREIGPTNSPTLDSLMSRPSMQRARRQAYELAKEEGRNPEGLGLTFMDEPDGFVSDLPPNEQPTVRQSLEQAAKRGPSKAPSQGKSLAKFIADGGGLKDDGGELSAMDAQRWNHGKAFQRRLIGDGDTADGWGMKAWEAGYFPELTERPTPRQLIDAIDAEMRGKPRYAREADQGASDRFRRREEADEMLYRGGLEEDVPHPDQYVGRPPPENGPVWTTEPTAETWDYMKRALDDQLEPYREGKKAWDGKARAINNTLQILKKELIELNPVYGQALEAYAGPAAMKDALTAGRRAFQEDAEVLGRKFADMGKAEQDMYRLGALQALKDKLGNADVTANAARVVGLLKPNQLERFREVFPTNEAYARFVKTLQGEETMFGTRSAAFGNSTTAKQLAGMQQEEPGALEQGVGLAMTLKTGGLSGVIGAINRIGAPKMSPATAEAIASILTNTDQAQLPQVIEKLLGARARQQAGEIAAQVARAQAATQGPGAIRPH
jgi:hypothetical protein